MKKIFFLLILVLLFMTGCSYNISKIDNDKLIDMVMKEKSKSTNTALKGYKIYLPSSMTMIDDINNNNVLYSNGNKYYLYVDLISYYNKTENSYKINEDKESFYSKILDYNGKKGYILITRIEKDYFIEVMYNYSKIEVIAKDYKSAIANSMIILKSIKFNDKVIETLIGKNVLKYDEEEFNLLGPSKETIDFLQEYRDVDNELNNEEEKEIEISDN